jgi:heme oxygenase
MKRATVYFDEDLHRALKLKSVECDTSLSEIVSQAVRAALAEDLSDLGDIATRKKEKPVSYESFLKKLKSSGRL